MVWFWLGAGVLLLLAAMTIIWPWWRFRSGLALPVTAMLLTVLVAVLYLRLGAVEDWRLYQALQRHGPTILDDPAWSERWRKALERRPDRPFYRLLAVRLDMAAGNYLEAARGYARMEEQFPDQGWIPAAHARALFLATQGQLTSEVMRLVERSLVLEPGQPVALHLKGWEAFRRTDYDQAIALWRKALQRLPEDSSLARESLALVELAGRRLEGLSPQPGPGPEQDAAEEE